MEGENSIRHLSEYLSKVLPNGRIYYSKEHHMYIMEAILPPRDKHTIKQPLITDEYLEILSKENKLDDYLSTMLRSFISGCTHIGLWGEDGTREVAE